MCRIDEGMGSESFVALLLSVFELTRKRTGGRFGPQQGAG